MHHMLCRSLLLLSCLCVSTVSFAEEIPAVDLSFGKTTAFSQSKGNCLACHLIAGGESAGNIGPPLISMKLRYPDKSVLRQRIWNATEFNPSTPMPPFGKHKILTENEIDAVVDFIWSL